MMIDHTSKPLLETKKDISKQYLGTGNIHAVGMRQKQDAVCVYTSTGEVPEHILKEIRKKAAPHKTIVLKEQQPMPPLVCSLSPVTQEVNSASKPHIRNKLQR